MMIISYVSRIIIKGNTNKIVNSFLFSNKCNNNENKSNCFGEKFLYKSFCTITNKDDDNEKVKNKIKKSKKLNNINDISLKDEEKKKLKGAKIKKESESQFTDGSTIFNEYNNNNNNNNINNNNNNNNNNNEAEYQFITVPTKFKEYNSNDDEPSIKEEEKEEEKEVTDIKDLKKPIAPTNLCCGSGCGSSCVWEVYFNEMDEYNKKLKKIDPNAKELPPDTSDDNEDPMQYFLKMERYNSMLQNKREEEREKEREKDH
ncbi:hypothetical protein ACTFIZ_007095 [Dictyostelium cf. discoideum]